MPPRGDRSDSLSAPPSPPPTLEERIRQRALDLGFDALGIARADVPLDVEHARYEAFLDAGMHGSMHWLAEHREVRRRLDTADILAGARSVLCLATRYARPDGEADDASVAAHVARYARGQDYHNAIRKRLRRLAAFVRELGEGVEARPMLDTAPVLERAWAARSGLGFVGKNGLIIVPGQGSYLLLGEVVTTLALTPDEPMHERCGSCTRCLDACPTGAFPAPFVLDAQRCVAYLTIEHRGPIEPPLRDAIGEHLFGCDVCQQVCPFNRTRPPDPVTTSLFAPLDRWRRLRPVELLEAASDPTLRQGSPLYRCPPDELIRNALTVVAHQRSTEALVAVARLAATHPEPWLRDHATWVEGVLRGALSAPTEAAMLQKVSVSVWLRLLAGLRDEGPVVPLRPWERDGGAWVLMVVACVVFAATMALEGLRWRGG